MSKPVELAQAKGHNPKDDPPFLSSLERWTCRDCGRAVVRDASRNIIYGSALDITCTEAKKANAEYNKKHSREL